MVVGPASMTCKNCMGHPGGRGSVCPENGLMGGPHQFVRSKRA